MLLSLFLTRILVVIFFDYVLIMMFIFLLLQILFSVWGVIDEFEIVAYANQECTYEDYLRDAWAVALFLLGHVLEV